MRFTILGKSPAWADAGGACSGYLLAEGDYRLLLDCGNGVFAKLRRHVDAREVDEVLVSHLHADHLLDLVPFAYALKLAPGAGVDARRPPLHLPPEGIDSLRRLTSVWGGETLIEESFEPREYGLEAQLQLGPLAAKLHRVPHFVTTHAVAFTAPSGGRLVFGADCNIGPEIVAAARGADVLIAEATSSEEEARTTPAHERGHMSAAEAGEAAAEAGAARLVLTHISDQLDPERAREAAAEAFGGPVEVAAEGMTLDV